MAGPWITDDVLTQRVADLLSKNPTDLVANNEDGSPSKWVSVISDSNKAAADDISGRLQARGFAAAQIDAFDRVIEFNRDIALFWALTKGGALSSFSDLFIQKLDRRKELDSVPLVIGGTIVSPNGNVAGGGATGGRMSDRATSFPRGLHTRF